MNTELIQNLMLDFADSTGVSGDKPPRRYLWTDAFAVCNFISLYRETDDERYLELARTLVDQVHHVLGRHREDDPREGWISGLPEAEGRKRPTAGGLRIGKRRNERPPEEPQHPREEWERDGQYLHYLTKWMHALQRMAAQSGENRYLHWARQLANTAHCAFTYDVSADGAKRMVWKRSIDLSRPLVASMGHHDPLDALVTYAELQTATPRPAGDDPDLASAVADADVMCQGTRWATDDPLGIGGLLDAAARLAELVLERGVACRRLLDDLLVEGELSLEAFAGSRLLSGPAEQRLAFRELGLSIGIHAMEQIASLVQSEPGLAVMVERLLEYRPLAERIERFWCDPDHWQTSSWSDHGDINTVMLATSLAPDGYLSLPPGNSTDKDP